MGSPRRGWQRPGVVFYPVVERFLLCVDPDAHQGNEGAVAIVNFMQYEGWEWGKIAAGGTLVMLPVAVFSVFVRRYLVRGLTAGGVKEERPSPCVRA